MPFYNVSVDDIYLQFVAKRVAYGVMNGEDLLWSLNQYPELDRENREKVKIIAKNILQQNKCSI